MTDVLVVAEHRRGELRDVSFELVTAGREVTAHTGGDLHVAVVGGETDAFAEALSLEGVDTVHAVDTGEVYNKDVLAQAIEQLDDALESAYLLTPHSVDGMDVAPAVATALDVALVTDVVAIVDGGDLRVTREQYGGKVDAQLAVPERTVLTVRPAEWPAAESDGDATIESVSVDIDGSAIGTTITGYEEVADGDIDISEAEFIVSIGRGIEEQENLELIETLADALGATLAASRPIVDNDWLPANRQVGQSGKTVTPEVYVAIGISGAVQHVAGMKASDTIVAINTDPEAPIFDVADFGIVGDLFDVVPELIELVE